MSSKLIIPSGKHDARFEIINTKSGDMLQLSYWTWSARAGFHQPYASFQIPIESVKKLHEWLGLQLAKSL